MYINMNYKTKGNVMTYEELIKWLEHAGVDHEEVEHFSDEAGASIWIRFDLEKEEDDEHI